ITGILINKDVFNSFLEHYKNKIETIEDKIYWPKSSINSLSENKHSEDCCKYCGEFSYNNSKYQIFKCSENPDFLFWVSIPEKDCPHYGFCMNIRMKTQCIDENSNPRASVFWVDA